MSDTLTLSRLPKDDVCYISELERLVYELFNHEKARVLLRAMRDHYFRDELKPNSADQEAIFAWFAKVEYLADLLNITDLVEEKIDCYNQRGQS